MPGSFSFIRALSSVLHSLCHVVAAHAAELWQSWKGPVRISDHGGVIRDQKVQMAKKLKDLRREMKKEPTSVTDTRVG